MTFQWQAAFLNWFVKQLADAFARVASEPVRSEVVVASRVTGQHSQRAGRTGWTARQANLNPRPGTLLATAAIANHRHAFGDTNRRSPSDFPRSETVMPIKRPRPWAVPRPQEVPHRVPLFLGAYRAPTVRYHWDGAKYAIPRVPTVDAIYGHKLDISQAGEDLTPNYMPPYASQLIDGVRSTWSMTLPWFSPGGSISNRWTSHENVPTLDRWNGMNIDQRMPWPPTARAQMRANAAYSVIAGELTENDGSYFWTGSQNVVTAGSGSDVLDVSAAFQARDLNLLGAAGASSMEAQRVTSSVESYGTTGPAGLQGDWAIRSYLGPDGYVDRPWSNLAGSLTLAWHGPRLVIDTRATYNPDTGLVSQTTRAWAAVYVTYEYDIGNGTQHGWTLVGAFEAHLGNGPSGSVLPSFFLPLFAGNFDLRDGDAWWNDLWTPLSRESVSELQYGASDTVTWPDPRESVGTWQWNDCQPASITGGERLATTSVTPDDDGNIRGRVISLYETGGEAWVPATEDSAVEVGINPTGPCRITSYQGFATAEPVMYDGDHGEIPRPGSGRQSTFRGLTIDGSQMNFAADAVTRGDGAVLGMVVSADYSVQMSVDDMLAWEGTLAELVPSSIVDESFVPLPHQQFMHPSWPFGVGTIRMSNRWLCFRPRVATDTVGPRAAPLAFASFDSYSLLQTARQRNNVAYADASHVVVPPQGSSLPAPQLLKLSRALPFEDGYDGKRLDFMRLDDTVTFDWFDSQVSVPAGLVATVGTLYVFARYQPDIDTRVSVASGDVRVIGLYGDQNGHDTVVLAVTNESFGYFREPVTLDPTLELGITFDRVHVAAIRARLTAL